MAGRAIITGGAGFIGSHLAERLIAEGWSVTIFDNFSTGSRDNVEAVVGSPEVVEGDVRDACLLDSVCVGAEWLFHLAALVSVPESVANPRETEAINGIGTVNALEAARRGGLRGVSYASSAAVYGSEAALPAREDAMPAPHSPYASTKLAGEHHCRVYSSEYGLACFPLRFFNIFGARQDPSGAYAAVISKFVDSYRAGVAPTIFGDGGQTRDFCHVSGVCDALLGTTAADPRFAGEAINIGTGESTSLLGLIAALNEIYDRPGETCVRSGTTRRYSPQRGRHHARPRTSGLQTTGRSCVRAAGSRSLVLALTAGSRPQ